MNASALKRRPTSTVDALPLHLEHQLLIRKVAALQSRVTDLVQTHLAAQRALEAEILQLRAQATVDRPRRLWAVPEQPATRRGCIAHTIEADGPGASSRQAAEAVLGQTGCVGHARAWLQVDGGFSRTGRACTELPPTASMQTRQDAACDRTGLIDTTDHQRLARFAQD